MSKKRLSEADDESEMTIKMSLKQEFKMYKSGGKGELVKSESEKYLTEDVEEERKTLIDCNGGMRIILDFQFFLEWLEIYWKFQFPPLLQNLRLARDGVYLMHLGVLYRPR